MRRFFVDYISFEREFSNVYQRLCDASNEKKWEKIAEAFDELMNLMNLASMNIRDYDIASKASYIIRILNKFISGDAALEITKSDLDNFQKLLEANANYSRCQRTSRQVRELQALIEVVPIIAKENRSELRHECWHLARRCGVSKEAMEKQFGCKRFTSSEYLQATCGCIRNSVDDELAVDIDMWLEDITATYPCIKDTKFWRMVKKHK